MTDKEKKLIDTIAELCQELGWSIAIPLADEEGDKVDGFIIGTEDYIEELIMRLDEFAEINFEDEDLLNNIPVKNNKKDTVH